MTPVRFYRIALAVPVLAPLVAFPLKTSLAGALLFSLLFGGVQYILFAIVLFVALGRLKTGEQIQRLVWAAPPLFVPIELAGCAIAFPEFRDLGALSFLAAYVLVIGYGYVIVVETAYFFVNKTGRIQHAP